MRESAERGGHPRDTKFSVVFNRLIRPIIGISQDVRPVPGHLPVVAIVASVCEKDAAGIVLR